MTASARAMVFEAPGQPLELRQFDLPVLKSGEILVKVRMTTLCGSDLHTFQGDRHTPSPTILGHEILGTVAELPSGESITDAINRPLSIGDRVTWSVAVHCGNCFFCQHNLTQKCAHLFKYGHQQIQPHHALSGGLAEYCHLAANTTVYQIPRELEDHIACPANCATATVVAALRAAGDCQDAVILIQGSGMLGLTAAAIAHSRNAKEVIVCDIDDQRLSRAKQFGATQTVKVDPDSDDLQTIVTDATAGRGVDVALEMSGAADAIDSGIELLRIGGRYIWVGAVFPTRPVSLSPESIVRKMIRIQGVHNYAPDDLAEALSFLESHHDEFPFATLVSKSFRLEEANAAFEEAAEHGALRVAVCPT
jgi:putative phosphonate catabolism associated alcohol dehydrogenase